MSEIVILAVCFQLKHLKKQPEKDSGLNGTRTHDQWMEHCTGIVYSYSYIHYHRVYDELTIDHLSMWLDSSVDRALHRYRKVMGSSPVQA